MHGQSVLICGSPVEQVWLNDVQSKLVATGQFTSVDIFNSGTATPTLASLTSYDAVLHFTDTPPFNNVDLGDNLAAYVDQGGGVVNCVFTMASVPLSGAFSSDTYAVAQYANAQSQDISLALGTVFDSSHPIMAGINLLNGGTSSYHSPGNSFVAGSTVLANWSNGAWLAAVRENVGPLAVRRADLNIYPPSSDARNDFWDSGTNGALLMANALTWVINGSGIQGCTDNLACNYNAAASLDDGSCLYAQTYFPDIDGDGFGNGLFGPAGVDQSQLSSNVCMANFAQPDLAQSFTPSNSVICGARIFITSGNDIGDVTISLYTNLPNAGGLLLAQGTDFGVASGQWAEVNWNSVSVSPGSTYYLVFSSSVQDLCIGGDVINPYAGGQVFANLGFEAWVGYDYTFETISCGGPVNACTQPGGYVSNSGDCNDNSNTVFPNATEICGNGIDEDCDWAIDEGSLTTYFYDFDNDGFGANADTLTIETCLPPAGYVTVNGDCNDYNAQLNPNGSPCVYGCVSPLSCNYDAFANTDNGSCTNITSNGFFGDYDPQNWTPVTEGSGLIDFTNNTLFIQGSDGFGGAPYNGVSIQIPVSGTYTFDYSYFTNDENAYFDMGVYINGYPIDLVEQNQISGSGTMSIFVYAGNTLGFGIQQIDDEFGAATLTISNFVFPVQCVSGCNDATACNFNEFVNYDDGSCNYPSITYYADADGDGFGDPSGNILGCDTAPLGFVTDNTDCNDAVNTVNPAAEEIAGNGIDENCDGQIDNAILEFENAIAIELFPNPTSQYLHLRLSNHAVGQNIELLDLTGRVIVKERILATQETLDVSSLAAGQYIYRCLNKSGTFSIVR